MSLFWFTPLRPFKYKYCHITKRHAALHGCLLHKKDVTSKDVFTAASGIFENEGNSNSHSHCSISMHSRVYYAQAHDCQQISLCLLYLGTYLVLPATRTFSAAPYELNDRQRKIMTLPQNSATTYISIRKNHIFSILIKCIGCTCRFYCS